MLVARCWIGRCGRWAAEGVRSTHTQGARAVHWDATELRRRQLVQDIESLNEELAGKAGAGDEQTEVN
eukprot:COSAG01_NODE_12184_length_1784_cov_1.674184_2_plen_68_part_00